MKFELRLDTEDIFHALREAEENGVECLSLVINGSIDKNKKVTVSKMYLHGECTEEYVADI